MDIIGTLSAVAAAYGYYKAGVYVVDTVDKGVRIYQFCKNAVGYIRRPFRYELETGSVSDSEIENEPPRPSSCNDIETEIERFNYDNDTDVRILSKSIANVSEFRKNREKSLSLCSEATELIEFADVSWVLVRNPDYDE